MHALRQTPSSSDLRDSAPIRFQCAILAVWPLLFAGVTTLVGRNLTSKQWLYLFSAPGGQWFYITVFAVGGLVTGLGVALGGPPNLLRVIRCCHPARGLACRTLMVTVRRRHGITAAGLYISGTACLMIVVFYLWGPLIEPGLITNGWTTWLLNGLWYYILAVTQAPGDTSWSKLRLRGGK